MTGPTPYSNEEQPAKQIGDAIFSLPNFPSGLNKETPFVVLRTIIIFMLPMLPKISKVFYTSVQ